MFFFFLKDDKEDDSAQEICVENIRCQQELNNDVSMQTNTFTVNTAITLLMELSSNLKKDEDRYSHVFELSERLRLLYPGRIKRGDYILQFDGETCSHKDICKIMIEDIKIASSPMARYIKWVKLLEDVYNNGTTNIINDGNDEYLLKSLVFWVTLQEQINYPKGMGRLHPFCRYAEAIGSTQTTAYTFEDILPRINNRGVNPRTFSKLVFPNPPSYYDW